MKRPAWYLVVDRGEEWEQPLRLMRQEGLPPRGVLDWGQPVALFTSRAAARDAIRRTERYRLAFDEAGKWPEAKACVIRRAVAV